jgi:hypothetical protein
MEEQTGQEQRRPCIWLLVSSHWLVFSVAFSPLVVEARGLMAAAGDEAWWAKTREGQGEKALLFVVGLSHWLEVCCSFSPFLFLFVFFFFFFQNL